MTGMLGIGRAATDLDFGKGIFHEGIFMKVFS